MASHDTWTLIHIQATKLIHRDTLRMAMDEFSAPVLRDIAQQAVRLAYLANAEAETKERMDLDFAELKGTS